MTQNQPASGKSGAVQYASKPLFAPVECWRDTSPIHAASSRPDLKTEGLVIVAAIADAVIGPRPGNTRQLHADGIALCSRTITASTTSMRFSSAMQFCDLGSAVPLVPTLAHRDRRVLQ